MTANQWDEAVWSFGDDRRYPVVNWVTGYDATAETFSCVQTMLPDGQTCGDPIPGQYDSDGDGTQDSVPEAPDLPTATSTDSTIIVTWTAPAATPAITAYRVYRNETVGNSALGNRPIAEVAASELSYTDNDPQNGENYYAVSAVNAAGEGARSQSVNGDMLLDVDIDDDGLIEIDTLEKLNNIRYNLAGTSHATFAGANGNSNGCPAGGCDGYELTQSLDFADTASYASGLIEMDWRPDDADPDMATNAGWDPIGGCETTDDLDYFQCFDDNDEPFVATFEGNGNTISGLYTRGGRAAGLFGSVGSSAVIRNVGVIGGASYGGADSSDIVGILASRNDGTIIASYATGTADGGGDGSSDWVGALVGWNDDSGTVIASYATGAANGGAEDNDIVGGLVGWNDGAVIAGYATGNADGGGGESDTVGALVGRNDGGEITASYATGAADGGAGGSDAAGALVGDNATGTIAASYGFGAVMGAETTNTDGAPPASVTDATALTATNASARWNAAADDTMGAWDFGDATQTPALRYADYDGTGTDYDCADYPAMLPDGSTLVCGTTLIPGQGR